MVKQEGRKVTIEGVRKVSWDTGEMCEFASALVSAMQCLGESVPYHYVMGVSGAAFRFTLNPGEWDFGNYSIRNISADPDEPMRRAIEATGYDFEIRTKTSYQADCDAIMRSIDAGRPVLAYRVVGPSDCCILTGYDEDGQVLLGWSTYQDIKDDHDIPHDTTGYFRKPGWHDRLDAYILLGARGERRSPLEIYLDAFRWADNLLRSPKLGEKYTGLKALAVWADEMTQAKYFPQGDDEVLGLRYVSAAVNMTMLRDHCTAEPFLRQALAEAPGLEPELARAADCYHDVSRLRSTMDDLIGDNFSQTAMQAIGDPSIRQAYADTIRQIRDIEQQAVTHIARLLERYG